MKEKIKQSILKHELIRSGYNVGVAVSGGADSVCLLRCMSELKEELNINNLVAISVDHSIRGKESEEDVLFVEKLCKELKVKCYTKKVDAIKFSNAFGYTLEQGARILRYNVFEEIKKELNLDVILLAHHKSDQAETIVMHAFRGCGLNGLVGMKPKSGIYARPMLDITREEIEESLLNKGFAWCTDSTNNDVRYTRNYIRNVVLKDAKKVYPMLENNLAKLSCKVNSVLDYIEKQTPKDMVVVLDKNSALINSAAKKEHIVIFQNIIFLAFKKLNKTVDIEEQHILKIAELFKQSVGKKINLPHGIFAIKDYDGVIIKTVEEVKEFAELPFKKNDVVITELGEIEIKKTKTFNPSKNVLFVDANKIPESASWRKLKQGDVFTKFGGGTKKVVDYLTNKKISAEKRSKIVALVDGNNVLVLPGIEIAESVKKDDNTKELLQICLKK